MPLENGLDRFREKEDKETYLTIFPSESRSVTVIKDYISTLRNYGIVVEYDNDTDPDSVLHSKDVLPSPEKLKFGFQGIEPWR